jgi:hypothetical protein
MTDTPYEAAREDVARALYEYRWKRKWESLRESDRNNWRNTSRGEIDAALTAAAPHNAVALRQWAEQTLAIWTVDGDYTRGYRECLMVLTGAADAIAATVCGGEK